jgi:membrane protease YdiL (CAAX protease family)
MRIEKPHRTLALPEILLIYFSSAFLWELIFSSFYSKFDNLGFFVSAASTVSIYLVAKILLKPDFLGCSIRLSDAPQIFLISIATVFIGIGSWSLLVYADALVNGDIAMKHWGLISVQEFNELRWSIPWLIGQLIVSSFLAPIMEEIIFRGFVLQRMREFYGPMLSIIISAGLFAAFHYNKSFVGVFLHGMIFGILAIRMCSIYAPIFVHCLYNTVVFILTTCHGFSIVGDRDSISDLAYWAPGFLCGLVGCVLLAIYFLLFPFIVTQMERRELV